MAWEEIVAVGLIVALEVKLPLREAVTRDDFEVLFRRFLTVG